MTSLAKVVPVSRSHGQRIVDWLRENVAEPAVSGLLSAGDALERADPRVLHNVARATGTAVGAIRGARRGHVEGAYEHLADEGALKKRVRRDQLLGAIAGGAHGYMRGNALGRPAGRTERIMWAANTGNFEHVLHDLAKDKSHFAAGLLRTVARKALNDKARTTEIGRQRRLNDDADSPTIMHNKYTQEERAALRKGVAARTKDDMRLLHRSKGYTREFHPEDIRSHRSGSGVFEDINDIVGTTLTPSLVELAESTRPSLQGLLGGRASAARRAKRFLESLEALKGLKQHITDADRARISAVSDDADLMDAVKVLRRRLSAAAHPDRPGGSAALMQDINRVVGEVTKTASMVSNKRNLQKLRGLVAAYNAQRPAES
jgi:hypothetical protein